MDFNIVILEITDHINHFDYYDRLVSEAVGSTGGSYDEQSKIRNKSKEHLNEFFQGTEIYHTDGKLKPLSEIADFIREKLTQLKTKNIHELIEKLERDAKKMKKLYKFLNKQNASEQKNRG